MELYTNVYKQILLPDFLLSPLVTALDSQLQSDRFCKIPR